jgi:hypothetical protein
MVQRSTETGRDVAVPPVTCRASLRSAKLKAMLLIDIRVSARCPSAARRA